MATFTKSPKTKLGKNLSFNSSRTKQDHLRISNNNRQENFNDLQISKHNKFRNSFLKTTKFSSTKDVVEILLQQLEALVKKGDFNSSLSEGKKKFHSILIWLVQQSNSSVCGVCGKVLFVMSSSFQKNFF